MTLSKNAYEKLKAYNEPGERDKERDDSRFVKILLLSFLGAGNFIYDKKLSPEQYKFISTVFEYRTFNDFQRMSTLDDIINELTIKKA